MTAVPEIKLDQRRRPGSTVKFPSIRLTDMYMIGCTEHPLDMAENALSICLNL